MKKLIYVFVIAAGTLGACKPKSDLDSKKEIVSLSDSTFYNSNYLTDTGAVANADEFIATGAVVSGKSTLPVKKSNTGSSGSSSSKSGTYSGGGGGSTGSSASTGTTAPAKKTGISKAAKGAIIGGVGGAAAGGIITRSGKGAGIGAVVGAAGGYIIGRSKDRKDGRVGN